MFDKKKIIFLPHCHSTNDQLNDWCKDGKANALDVLWTDYQTSGKGQRGNYWESKPGENLLLSIVLKPEFMRPEHQYLLNLVTSLALFNTISTLGIKNVQIKWPNDIYIGIDKVAGILIESSIQGHDIEYSVVGVGLNVNQLVFDIEHSTSLSIQLGRTLDRKKILTDFLDMFYEWYLRLQDNQREFIVSTYHEKMMWRFEQHRFSAGGVEFVGQIQGINDVGQLMVETFQGLKTFNVREISYIG